MKFVTCPLYNKSWQFIGITLNSHLTFQDLNPSAFCFQACVTNLHNPYLLLSLFILCSFFLYLSRYIVIYHGVGRSVSSEGRVVLGYNS